jgi:hypothetical protein
MPKFNTTTKEARSVWKSPDGQREIFQVVLDYEGQSVTGKTYSKDISNVGWTGEVETYEKEGRNGAETFVKQPQKEGFSGGSSGGGYAGGGKPSGGRPTSDPFTMYLSYAKDVAVAMLEQSGVVNPEALRDILISVLAGGHLLHDGRPGAEPKAEQAVLPVDTVHEVDETAPIDLKELDKLFPPKEEEKPWNSN